MKPAQFQRIAFMLFLSLFPFRCPTLADTHYVKISNLSPLSPYKSWETAATNIQQAVDVANDNDVIMVSNGNLQIEG